MVTILSNFLHIIIALEPGVISIAVIKIAPTLFKLAIVQKHKGIKNNLL